MQQRPELPASSIGVQAPSAAPAAQSRSVRRRLSPGPLEMFCCQVWSSPPHPHLTSRVTASCRSNAWFWMPPHTPRVPCIPGGNTGDHLRVKLLLALVKQTIIALIILFNYYYFRCCWLCLGSYKVPYPSWQQEPLNRTLV